VADGGGTSAVDETAGEREGADAAGAAADCGDRDWEIEVSRPIGAGSIGEVDMAVMSKSKASEALSEGVRSTESNAGCSGCCAGAASCSPSVSMWASESGAPAS
jgi:hypothetical protein